MQVSSASSPELDQLSFEVNDHSSEAEENILVLDHPLDNLREFRTSGNVITLARSPRSLASQLGPGTSGINLRHHSPRLDWGTKLFWVREWSRPASTDKQRKYSV